MNAWMMLWTSLLAASCLSFLGMLILVGGGAVRELRESLAELRDDTRDAAEHPETLDEAIQ